MFNSQVCSCDKVISSSCRGLTVISQMLCEKSTAQRESLYRYKNLNIGIFLPTNMFFLTLSSLPSLLLTTSRPHPYHRVSHLPPPLAPILTTVYPTSLPLSSPPTSLPSHPILPSQDVKPLMVATAMARTSISLSGTAENSRFVADPVTYAHAAVATIGIQHTTYGYFYHALQVGLCSHGYR